LAPLHASGHRLVCAMPSWGKSMTANTPPGLAWSKHLAFLVR
jgi:hypothetical protein